MAHTYEYPRPAITADVVVLRGRPGAEEVLLIRRAGEPFRGSWALPGGFVDEGETLAQAAARELAEETGLRVPASGLVQAGAFGDPGRDPRGWTVSVAFAARAGAEEDDPVAGDDAAEAAWQPLAPVLAGRIPVAFDHLRMIESGAAALAAR